MTQRLQTLALFAAGLGMLTCGQAWAQGVGGGRQPTGSNLTSGVGFGNAGFGSNTGLGSTGGFGGGGLGTGGFGGGGLGQGGLGQGGFGQGGLGQSGFGAGGGFGGQQGAGAFIGRDSADVASMFESMTRQGQQNANGGQRGGNNNRGREANSGDAGQQRVRVQLKVAFEVPDAATSPMATALSARLAKVLEERNLSDFDFTVDQGNVTIQGVAGDDFERLLVEQLVAQQPGVVTVTNQMTVAEEIDAPTRPE